MKKLLIPILLSALSLTAKAQALSVQITNNTACHVTYVLHGGPSCSPSTFQTSPIVMPPYSSVTSTPASLPWSGGTAPTYINYVTLLDRVPACLTPPVGYLIGENCASVSASQSKTYITNNANTCTPCSSVTATWTDAAGAGRVATLVFN